MTSPPHEERGSFSKLTLPPDLTKLSEARSFVERIGREAGLSEDRLFDLQVVVSEGCANAIEHAASAVEIEAWHLPDRLIVEITNDGTFQPGLYKDDEHRRRGLGLPLMVSLADQVHVARPGDGKTRVSLTFFLEASSTERYEPKSEGPGSVVGRLEAETLKLDAVRARETFLADVLERASQPFGVGYPDGRLGITNAAFAHLLGYSKDELGSLEWGASLTPPEWSEMEAVKLEELHRTGEPVRYEKEYVRSDGSRVPVELLVHLVRDPEGEPLYYYSFITNITERKQAEKALRESEEGVRRKLDILVSPDGDVAELELADIIDGPALQSFLEDFHRLAGIPLAIVDLKGKVLVGAGWSDICSGFHRVHPNARKNCVESDTLLTTGVPEGKFRLYKCKNHMWDIATPIMVGGRHVGNVFAGQFFFDDERVDRELFRSQAREYGFEEEAYLTALDSVPLVSREALNSCMSFFTKLAGMLSKDSYGRIRLARSVAERDALLDSVSASEEQFRAMFERHKAVMLLVDPEGGAIIDGNDAAAQEQDVLVSLAPAITEAFARKRAEEGLLRTKAALEEAVVKASSDLDAARRLLSERTRHLDAFFDHSLTPLVLLDRNFNFIRVNEAYAKACAKTVDDFPGHNHFEFYPSDARPVFEQVLRAKEPFQVTARPFEFPDHPDWGMTYWDWTLTPLLDEYGEVEALVFALEDVTSRVKASKTRRLIPGAWLAGRRLGERKRAALFVPIATAVEVLLFLGISRLGPPSRYLGIPGAAAALIGVVAAVAAGPVAGAIVALAGGVAYLAFLAEFGRAISWPAIIGSIVLWTLASVVAGIGADWVRRRAADRETLLSQSVKDRDALMKSLRESSERYRVVADFTYDWEDWLGPDGRFVYVSPSVQRVTGHRREEFIEDPGLFLSLVHREDREAIGRLFELLDATPARLEFRIVRADGEERWIERACQMMYDADGRLLGRRGSNRDVTERKRAETERERLLTQEQDLVEELSAANEELRMQTEELAVRDEELQSQNEELVLIQEGLTESGRLSQALNHVNESLNSILEFSEVLRQVVREGAVALDAERAVLELREEDGWLVQELLGLPEHLRGSHLSQEEASVATAMVLQGDILVIEDARRDPRVNTSTLLRYGTTAALVVPVRLRGLILGSLHFIWASGRRTFSIAEMDFARKLTTSLAFALENARLLEEQTNIAERLQLALLDMPQQAHGVEFGHLYRSATEKASVGGDFYDVFPLKDGRIAALIGDVSGHGVDAARIAILVKDVVHAFAHEFRSPSAILRKTNELLIQEGTPGFVTMFFGTLDTQGGLLTYASAGHPNVLRRTGDRAVVLLEAASAPLGVFGDHSWEESEVRLREEDLLFLYTDGAIEARRNGDFFGQKGLIEALKRWSEPSPELLPQAVLAEVLTFSGGVLTDDVAMVALRLTDGGAHGSPPQG
ncbi:MAG TPA: PAS domain S-box protein [Thermoleophilia bacterium]